MTTDRSLLLARCWNRSLDRRWLAIDLCGGDAILELDGPDQAPTQRPGAMVCAPLDAPCRALPGGGIFLPEGCAVVPGGSHERPPALAAGFHRSPGTGGRTAAPGGPLPPLPGRVATAAPPTCGKAAARSWPVSIPTWGPCSISWTAARPSWRMTTWNRSPTAPKPRGPPGPHLFNPSRTQHPNPNPCPTIPRPCTPGSPRRRDWGGCTAPPSTPGRSRPRWPAAWPGL